MNNKFLYSLLEHYFDNNIVPGCFSLKDFLDTIKNDTVFKGEIEAEVLKIGDNPDFITEQESFEMQDNNKRRFFKFSNFWQYYYGCLIISNKFLTDIETQFNQNNHFGVEKKFIPFAENNIKTLFKEKYTKKDTEIVSNFEWILECDIQNFYPSIYTHIFPRIVDNDSGNYKFSDCKKGHLNDINQMGHWIDCFIRSTQNKESIGLPIGSALFRLFAEIVSIYIDTKLINGYTVTRGGKQLVLTKGLERVKHEGSRVVDDRLIGFNTEHEAKNALEELRIILHDLKLSINDDKTRIVKSKNFYNERWVDDIKNIRIVNQNSIIHFNNKVFYWYNTLQPNKERSKMMKYASRVFVGKVIKKFKNISVISIKINKDVKIIPNKVTFDLLYRIFNEANYLAPIVFRVLERCHNVSDKERKDVNIERFIHKAINIIEASRKAEGGHVLWCLVIIKYFHSYAQEAEVKSKLFKDNGASLVKKNIANTKNSLCIVIWNELCDLYKKKGQVIELENQGLASLMTLDTKITNNIEKGIINIVKKKNIVFYDTNTDVEKIFIQEVILDADLANASIL